MEPYRNLRGDSSVRAFELGPDSITVEFSSGATYLYTNSLTGSYNIEQMKRLAEKGAGLGSFISKYVHDRYAHRLK